MGGVEPINTRSSSWKKGVEARTCRSLAVLSQGCAYSHGEHVKRKLALWTSLLRDAGFNMRRGRCDGKRSCDHYLRDVCWRLEVVLRNTSLQFFYGEDIAAHIGRRRHPNPNYTNQSPHNAYSGHHAYTVGGRFSE